MSKLVTRQLLREEFIDKMMDGKKVSIEHPVDIVNSAFKGNIPKNGSMIDDTQLSTLNSLESIHSGQNIVLSGKYRSGLEYVFSGRGSIIDRIKKGSFSASNTLNDNWNDLYDAVRLDLTIRKMGRPTIRQFIYDEVQMPNASKDVRPTELFPYGVVFEPNTGEGQSVRQAANLGGQYDTIPMNIYAAGFTWTLLAALFDNTYDLSRLSEGVAVGESAKKDDLAIAPIIAGTYASEKATAASAVGTLRQEKLMNTLMDGIDDLSDRIDPITKRKIVGEGLILLCSSKDARHIQHVMSGLGNSTPEKYTPLNQIRNVIGYDGEVIDMPNETITYGGVTSGAVYLIKPNRYFKIPIKRNLTMEMDAQPNVNTLTQEQRAWYFVEGMYNSIGILNFVQKITLPVW